MLYDYIIIYDYKTGGKKEGNTTAYHRDSTLKRTSLYLIYSQEVSQLYILVLMCTFLSISYKDVLVLLFTYFKLYFVYCNLYISAGIQLYKSPEGGQLKNQQPSKSPSSASAQKRAFSSCCGTKGMCGNASQRHSFIS